MALSPQWLDELRTRVTLSSLIGRTLRIQKAGREFRGCCPFHNEKTPSFYVNDDKGFYHCFGCGAHGDAIRWMTDQRGLPFMDAIKELAQEAGMEVPAPDPRAAKAAENRASLHDVMAAAQQFFIDQLASQQGAEARRYLEQRGISAALARDYGFGFAPDERQALKSALSGYDEPMRIEAGLRIAVEGKDPYDRFRGRLMLPIQDARGRVIAFGGRIIGAGEPKYLNSPDTPLFDKGRTLFNLHRAAPASRSSNRVIVVEGYMDVVALAGAGFAEAVAPLGTALTEHQLDRLWKLAERPILCFDGDSAGQRAAMRAMLRALPLLRPGYSLAIATLPAGLDPDDLVKRDGPAAMEKLLMSAKPLVDQLWEAERDAAPLATPEDKAGLKARLMTHVDTILDVDIKSLYRRELLDRFGELAFRSRQNQPLKPGNSRNKDYMGASRGYNGGKRGVTGGYRAIDPRPSASAKAISRDGLADRLEAMVIPALEGDPAGAMQHLDLLQQMNPANRTMRARLDVVIDRIMMGSANPVSLPDPGPLEQDGPLPISGQGFLSGEELRDALRLLVERPAIEAALAAALTQFESDPEAAFAEQQRLRERKLAFERRMLQLAGLQAGG